MTKNIYFKILRIYNNKINNCMSLQIKNIFTSPISFKINNLEYTLDIEEIKYINFSLDQNLEINNETIDLSYIQNKQISGFNENTFVETKNGPVKVKNLESGDLILDSYGNDLKISNIYIFEINKKSLNKPIIIKKSKCGIQLPSNDIVMTIRNNLIIKKIVLKGRSLFLNGKAEIYPFDDSIKIYGIETENKKDFLLSGFIVESI